MNFPFIPSDPPDHLATVYPKIAEPRVDPRASIDTTVSCTDYRLEKLGEAKWNELVGRLAYHNYGTYLMTFQGREEGLLPRAALNFEQVLAELCVLRSECGLTDLYLFLVKSNNNGVGCIQANMCPSGLWLIEVFQDVCLYFANINERFSEKLGQMKIIHLRLPS
jgi:hypothetical protein